MFKILFLCFCLQKLSNSAIIPIQIEGESKLSLVEWENYNFFEPEGPGTYAFGYDINNPEEDNIQFRNEERHLNGTVTGNYGYVQPDGNVYVVRYIADERGYRAKKDDSFNTNFLKPIKIDHNDLASNLQDIN